RPLRAPSPGRRPADRPAPVRCSRRARSWDPALARPCPRSRLGRGATGACQDLTHRVAELRAVLDPLGDLGLVVTKLGRLARGIVNAELFDVATVARAAAVRGDDAVKRGFFSALSGETNLH